MNGLRYRYAFVDSLAGWDGSQFASMAHLCIMRPENARTDKASAIFVGIVKRVTTPVYSVSPAAVSSGRRRAGDPVQTVEKQYSVASFEVTENFVGAESAGFAKFV